VWGGVHARAYVPGCVVRINTGILSKITHLLC